MIFTGCYSGVDDAAADSSDEARWGKRCYYSYSTNRSASYKASSSNNDSRSAKTDNGFELTMEVDPTARKDEAELLNQLRLNAGMFAAHHIEQSCWEADEIAEACWDTCGQRGLKWDERSVVCETCEVLPDGTVHCPEASESLRYALDKPWSGHEPWFFVDEESQLQLVLYPPHLEDREKGRVWVAEVEVNGFCNCACTAD